MSNKLIELKETEYHRLPRHVGIVPDGNRRFARQNNLDIKVGHYMGYETLKKILFGFFDAGIKYLTIYALSLENAKKRNPQELKYIYKIIKLAIDAVMNEPIVVDEKVRFRVIGRLSLLPQDVRDKIEELQEFTKDHTQNFVNVLIMYDGRAELVDAMKKMAEENIDPQKIDEKNIKKHLYTHDFPELDYLIRTGMNDGARISGFLLWDASYAEFKFRNEFWPEYSEEMLYEDLMDYLNRNRRKGK